LTDKLPYEMPAQATWNDTVRFEKPLALPSAINPEADPILDRIVQRALQKDPSARFSTAIELLAALERYKPRDTTTSAVAKEESFSSEASKTVLGPPTPADELAANALVTRAFKIAGDGRLAEAADLMEEAFNKLPALRDKYSRQVRLWRCGIAM
jgi:serine/threonine-protein kinase